MAHNARSLCLRPGWRRGEPLAVQAKSSLPQGSPFFASQRFMTPIWSVRMTSLPACRQRALVLACQTHSWAINLHTWLMACLGLPGPWLLTIGLQYTVSPWIRLVAAFLHVKNACRKMATQVDTNLRYIQFSAVKRLSREDSANPLCSRVSKALAQC